MNRSPTTNSNVGKNNRSYNIIEYNESEKKRFNI